MPTPPVSLGRDIARFGTAITLTVALGAVQVFVLPRRLDLATYGEYRLFLVYVAYFGVLHLGLADGAFVRWAGRAPGEIHREWRRAFWWMLAMEGTLALAAVLVWIGAPESRAAMFAAAFALCALFVNVSALAAFALQAAGDFKRAGIVAVVATASFVAAVSLVPMHSITAVFGTYAGSLALGALVGGVMVARLPNATGAGDVNRPMRFGSLLDTGIHVLGSNLAAGLAQSVDRILVSVVVPMTSMALYGFASSVAVAGISATQTMSRVALSHAARRSGDDRARFFGRFYDLTLTAYGVALVGVPLFEHVVARTLPAYVEALPIVRAFVAGAPFWIALHVVLVGTLQSHGLVRRQFALELGGAALVFVASGGCLLAHTPLWVVAGVATGGAAVTWGAGVAMVNRAVPAAREQGAGRFLVVCLWQSGACAIAIASGRSWVVQMILYAALAVAPTILAARRAAGSPNRTDG
jgi:O-antigen/teichoic acid export membrane protein